MDTCHACKWTPGRVVNRFARLMKPLFSEEEVEQLKQICTSAMIDPTPKDQVAP